MFQQPKKYAHRFNNIVSQPESEQRHFPTVKVEPVKDMGSELTEEDRQRIREWAPGFKKKHEKTFKLLADSNSNLGL